MKNFTLILLSTLLFGTAHSQVLDADFSMWENDLPTGWYGEKSNIFEENVLQADNNGGQGDYAVELVNTESSHKRFTTQAMMVEAGVNYEITFWARGTGDLRTGLFDDREDGFGYVYSAYVNLSSDTWTEYTQNIVAAENTSDAEFILSVRNTAGDLNVQIDRVVIETAEINAVSIYDIQYTDQPDGNSPVVNEVVTTTGIVTAVGAGGYFLQDEAGAWNGIFVFTFDEPAIGDEVVVTGLVEEFNGTTELTGTTGFTVLSEGNTVESVDINTQQVNTEAYESVLARIQNANCVEPSAAFGEFIVDDGSGACFVNPTIYDYEDAALNQNYDITGIVFYSFETFKIMPRMESDVQIATGIADINTVGSISLFPNPATDILNLTWDDAAGNVAYNIYSANGQQVKRGTISRPMGTLDVSELTPGIYNILFESETELLQTRISIVR